MFTGIIEGLGKVISAEPHHSNLTLILESPFTNELKVDQSLAHNGVCLTVTHINDSTYSVTAIKETLDKTNLSSLSKGSKVNLERCLKFEGRLDGHLVQGHVDDLATCTLVMDENGSWTFRFEHNKRNDGLIVKKGSICINGVSLTVADCGSGWFTVAIIPYTYEHTTFHQLKAGDKVNIEYDILGKYVSRLIELRS
jgi:riboflavin synthase